MGVNELTERVLREQGLLLPGEDQRRERHMLRPLLSRRSAHRLWMRDRT